MGYNKRMFNLSKELFVFVLGLNLSRSIHQKQTFHLALPFPLGIRNGKLKFWNFDCLCELCEKEKKYCDDISYETFVKLNQEAEIIKSNQSSMVYPITYMRLVILFKEMYKLAKEKHCPRTFIVQKLLQG